MRKVLFVLFLLILSIPLLSQDRTFSEDTTSVPGVMRWLRLGDFDKGTKIGEYYYGRLPVEGITRPYLPYLSVRDSVVGQDTATYNFEYKYQKGYVSIFDTSTTVADTLVLEYYSLAKPGWTNLSIGFKNVLTNTLEADNTSIIIAANTTKTYEINFSRPGQIRVRPKTLTGRAATKVCYIVFTGEN